MNVKYQFEEYCKTDRPFNLVTTIEHLDGSTFTFRNSSVWISECGRFLGVSTEHCGDHLFCVEDLVKDTP